jgi:hypothetical protein
MDDASCLSAASLELFEVGTEMLKHVSARFGGSGAQGLPVVFLEDESGAFVLDYIDGVRDILAELRISQDG